MDTNQMIARHAYIRAGVQRDYQDGRQTPPHIMAELQRIEARAQAMFSPMELQQAQAASQAMEAQYIQQHDVKCATVEANTQGYYREQLSRDLTGMGPDQLMAAKAGEMIPVKGVKTNKHVFKGNLQNLIKQNGLKITHDNFVKVADRVEELRGAGKDIKPYLKNVFGKKALNAENLIGGYHMSGIGIESALVGSSQPDYLVKPTKNTQMRASIADAWAHSAMKDDESREAIITDIDPAYTDPENDTLQGDIARVMQKMDREQQSEDRANYSPPTYDIEIADEPDEISNIQSFG